MTTKPQFQPGTATPAYLAHEAEMRTSCGTVTVERLRSTVNSLDEISQHAFGAIEAFARLALVAIDQTHNARVTLDDVKKALLTIEYKACDGMNEINAAAERIGCNFDDGRQLAQKVRVQP